MSWHINTYIDNEIENILTINTNHLLCVSKNWGTLACKETQYTMLVMQLCKYICYHD